MTDRELLECAAKAAGLAHGGWSDTYKALVVGADDHGVYRVWNPLEDNGEALWLAMMLDLLILPYPADLAVRVTRLDQPDTCVAWGSPPDRMAATRRAIVLRAAAIGGNHAT